MQLQWPQLCLVTDCECHTTCKALLAMCILLTKGDKGVLFLFMYYAKVAFLVFEFLPILHLRDESAIIQPQIVVD